VANQVKRGHHVVLGEPKPGVVVWRVDTEPDRRGRCWIVRPEHHKGDPFQTVSKRVHVSVLVVVEVTEVVYMWPNYVWDPERAKAAFELQKSI
jgi:hypothetical protein